MTNQKAIDSIMDKRIKKNLSLIMDRKEYIERLDREHLSKVFNKKEEIEDIERTHIKTVKKLEEDFERWNDRIAELEEKKKGYL